MEKAWKKKMDRHARRIMRRVTLNKARRRILLPFVKLRKPMEIVWNDSYGGSYPACPRCGELVYYSDMCCFCGQRFKENDKTVGGVMDAREC